MNTLILTKNAPPMLSPLFKKASKQSIALKQSDMLKVIITVLLINKTLKALTLLLLITLKIYIYIFYLLPCLNS